MLLWPLLPIRFQGTLVVKWALQPSVQFTAPALHTADKVDVRRSAAGIMWSRALRVKANLQSIHKMLARRHNSTLFKVMGAWQQP